MYSTQRYIYNLCTANVIWGNVIPLYLFNWCLFLFRQYNIINYFILIYLSCSLLHVSAGNYSHDRSCPMMAVITGRNM